EMLGGRVAVIDIKGPLAAEPDTLCGWYDGYGGPDGIAARFERVIRDPSVSAVILRLSSEGGTSVGLLECIGRMCAARDATGKLVFGWISKEACSACYWIAAAVCSSGLFGGEATEAGSIGSYIPHESIAGMLAKDGVAMTLVADPPGKTAGNPYE